jgi:hypothetical protein
MTAGLLQAALAYTARGWPVFPRLSDKTPAIRRGVLAATTNPETIRRYWRVADRNIGVRTGASSDIWVLDIDGETGETEIRELEATHGPLPATLRCADRRRSPSSRICGSPNEIPR